MYYCTEGIKGSGKTTIFQMVAQILESQGIDFITVCPTYPITDTFILIEWISKKLPSLRKFSMWEELLYRTRYKYLAKNTNWEHPIILGDRSAVTRMVTLGTTKYNKLFLPLPDVIFYIDIPIYLAINRISNRERGYGGLEEKHDRIKQTKERYECIFEELNDSCEVIKYNTEYYSNSDIVEQILNHILK